MHDVGFVEVGVGLVDLGSVTFLSDVVIQVPALVFIKHSEDGVLLLVCFQLEKQTKTFIGPFAFREPFTSR